MKVKPHKIYSPYIDGKTLSQFYDALKQEWAVRGALMPDAHLGYSLPIGGVVATDGVISPAYVGYDIGCGMCALKVEGVTSQDIRAHSEAIFRGIYGSIPTGFSINRTEAPHATNLKHEDLTPVASDIALSKNWLSALGSLGGGNHFIEIGATEEGEVWIVIHSGSRGVGHGIATHYMKLASNSRKAKEGHHVLSVSSEMGQAYINDMNWTLQYALDNRAEMMRRVLAEIAFATKKVQNPYPLRPDTMINRNHNHATERDGLWIHRKGATHAEKGMLGVIPGNMRDGSFIVRGLGNPESLYSSSHGAGRVLGRKQAKEQLDVGVFHQQMEGVTALVNESTLDESPDAYKNIWEVMLLQKDLVEVVAHIMPLINIKAGKLDPQCA